MSAARRILACATLALGPVLALHAQAAATATAEIGNLQFTLEDLDLADGIAPSYSIVTADPTADEKPRTELTVGVDNALTAETDSAIFADFSFIAALDLQRTVTGNTAHTTSNAGGLTAYALSEAKGRANGFASAVTNIGGAGDFGIMLSPMTRLTLTADAVVLAADDGTPGAMGYAFEWATAEAFIRLTGPDPGDGSGAQSDQSTRTATTLVDALAQSLDESGQLSVTFQNLSASPLFASLSMRGTVDAFGVSPVIPEPSTWALWLGGLAGLAAVARRRRTQAQG
jgi:hypothetical protein